MPCCTCSDKDSILHKYPEKAEELKTFMNSLSLGSNINKNRGHLINCLHRAQSIFGYLPKEIQIIIADKLRLHVSDVYGVISFYSFFTTKPPGRNKISVCMGTACFVKGSDRILQEFESQLSLKDGETSKDLKFSLGGLRCVGACSLAPVVLVNEKVYAKVTPKKVAEIIKECK
jgi:NADH-quinone oxidoreductase subunit E